MVNKAFFFANFEQLRFPLKTADGGILTPLAQSGTFRYAVAVLQMILRQPAGAGGDNSRRQRWTRRSRALLG